MEEKYEKFQTLNFTPNQLWSIKSNTNPLMLMFHYPTLPPQNLKNTGRQCIYYTSRISVIQSHLNNSKMTVTICDSPSHLNVNNY